MKKVLNIVLLFILGLGLISCDRMLKDPLVEGAGFGDVILNEADVTVDSNLSVTVGALNLTSGKIKIDGSEKGNIGTVIKNVISGLHKIDVEITKSYNDGKYILTGTKNVKVNANEEISVGSFNLSTETGYGSINVTTAGISIEASVTQGALDLNLNKATLKIDGVTKTIGTKISDIKAGDIKVYMEVPSADGKTIYYTEVTKTVVAPNLLTINNIVLDKAKAGTNAYKFIFNPADYGITTENANAIKEVHLVGKLPLSDWKPLETNYPLIKQSNGTWTGIFEIATDTEFKFIFDPVSGSEWDNAKGYENHKDKDTLMATYPALAWGNYKVIEMTGIVERVLAWKFIFNPADYGITTENANAIKEVHLVGKLPLSDWKPLETNYPLIKQSNGTWTGIFEIATDTEFKFIFDPVSGSEWDNAKGYENHKDKDTLMATYPALAWGNYKVIEIPSIITQNF